MRSKTLNCPPSSLFALCCAVMLAACGGSPSTGKDGGGGSGGNAGAGGAGGTGGSGGSGGTGGSGGSGGGNNTDPVALGAAAAAQRGCEGCHTGTKGTMAGGDSTLPGTSVYARNVTFDLDTGLGSWTDQQIVDALKLGKDDTGADLCQQMPRFSTMSDAEALNIVAWLKSLPKVRNDIPENMCNAMSLEEQGKLYASMHGCAFCHQNNPQSSPLSGRDKALNGTFQYPPNLTPDPDTGLGKWTDQQILAALTQGIDDQGQPLCGKMPKLVLTKAEGDALVAYLRSIPPVDHAVPEGLCAERGNLPDAGSTDAGKVDSGSPDAGKTDAGTTPDAGTVDSGTVDAGKVDSGTVDAGKVDSGTVDAGKTDGGKPFDGGTSDAGFPGFWLASSHNNKLPPAWIAPSWVDLKTTAPSTAAQAQVATRVRLNGSFAVSNSPCPIPYNVTTCDGFYARTTDGGTVVADWYQLLPSNVTCNPVPNPLSGISGVWVPHIAASDGGLTWVLGVAECADMGAGIAPTRTAVPPASSTIAQLNTNWAVGQEVTIVGVVTSSNTFSGYYVFTVQDPTGGPNSGITVIKQKVTGQTLGTAPLIGDYVTVIGTTYQGGVSGRHGISL